MIEVEEKDLKRWIARLTGEQDRIREVSAQGLVLQLDEQTRLWHTLNHAVKEMESYLPTGVSK